MFPSVVNCFWPAIWLAPTATIRRPSSYQGSAAGSRLTLLLGLLAIALLGQSTAAGEGPLEVDNGVLGTPEVECGREFVHFRVATKKQFRGKVYVKGEYDNQKCVRNGADRNGVEKEEEEEEHKEGGPGTFGDEPEAKGEQSSRRGGGGGEGPDERREGTAEEGRRERPEEGKEVEEETGGPADGEQEEDGDGDTVRQILQELQRRREGNLGQSQRPIPSRLPGFGSAEQLKRWRSFLGGKPGLDGQGFRRYGSRLSPDANGECPLVCPPCEDCANAKQTDEKKEKEHGEMLRRRRRRLADHSAQLRIPLGECNTRRDRMANPPGMQLSLVVVVSFHPNFITRVDRAYNIQCAYQEPERLLSTQIDVQAPQVIPISNQMQSPQCEYRIHGQTDASQVRNVRVGDMVEHEWHCHGPGEEQQQNQQAERTVGGGNMAHLFGLLVHDCFADDGKGRRERVVDSRGCSVEPLILPTPVYSPDSLRASVLSSVAKFPDGDLIGFQCSITVCMKELGRCDGMTPPDCSAPNAAAVAHQQDGPNRTRRALDDPSLDWELHSPLMTVFDLADQRELALAGGGEGPSPRSLRQRAVPIAAVLSPARPPFCLSVPMFAALVSVCTFLCTVSAGTLLAVLLLGDRLEPVGRSRKSTM